MSTRSTRGIDSSVELDTRLSAARSLALGFWNPFLIGAVAPDADAYETLRSFICEWQEFIARRLREDSTLMQHLAHCKSSNEVWSAYSDFWRKAVEDYGKECATMNSLVVGATNRMVAIAQHTTEHAGGSGFSSRNVTRGGAAG